MRKVLYKTVLGATLLMAACADQETVRPTLSDKPLVFSASVASDWNTTRSILRQNAAEAQELGHGLYLHTVVAPGFGQRDKVTRGTKVLDLTEFSVSGYSYDAGHSQTVSDVQANFINNEQITYKEEGGQWLSSQPFYWPLSGYALDFYAYSPTAAATVVPNVNGPMQLSFEVNTDDIEAQTDLLVAKATDQTFAKNAIVDLEFQHALTAVQFVLGTDIVPGTIKSIKLEEVYTTGTLNTGTGVWTLVDAPDYTISFISHDTSDDDLLTGEKTLLMIPQEFTSENQRIVVVVNDGVQDYTLSHVLKGTAWEANTTVTYKITTSELNMMTMGTVTFPTTWGTGANSVTYPFKSTYAENDAIGVFAVDGAGKVVNANVKYRYNGTAWVKDDTQNTFFPPTFTFYAYYPYQETLTDAPAKGSNVLVEEQMPTATQFFNGARGAWAPAAEQNTEAAINAQDLQYAQGVVTNGTTVDFTMAHTMGLAAVTLGTKSVPNIRYFNYSTGNKIWDTEELTEVTASSTFSGNIPLQVSDTYYYIVNGSGTLQGASTDIYAAKALEIELASGTYGTFEAECKRDYIYRGWEYGYTGGAQTWQAPCAGTYKMECWGAQGGNGWAYDEITNDPIYPEYGKGGYTYGEFTQEPFSEYGTRFYIYVGGNGIQHSGWNGGGAGPSPESGNNYGGGATDIRNISTQNGWSDTNSLRSRVMVAGGGGGASHGGHGGHGGNLTGANGVPATNERLAYGYGGGQTSGGSAGTFSWSGSGPTSGTFGTGGRGNSNYGGGGGGGYYGGGGSGVYQSSCGGAGGGSSFISGYPGCRALASSSSTTHKAANAADAAVHYSGIVFQNPSMEQGVRKGDGLARITSTVIE